MGVLLHTAIDPQRQAQADAADGISLADPAWPRMTILERDVMVDALTTYGDTFGVSLSAAWRVANHVQAARLGRAWPDLVRQYGPGSEPYRRIADRRQRSKA